MTKLLYTKQEIIEKSSIIAGLVAEINLRDDRPNPAYLGIWITPSSLDVRLGHMISDGYKQNHTIACVGFLEEAWLHNTLNQPNRLNEVIQKLTNFKWSDINENN